MEEENKDWTGPQLARAVPKACTLQPTSPHRYLHRPALGGYNSCACLCPQPASHQWPSRPLGKSALPLAPSCRHPRPPLCPPILFFCQKSRWSLESPLREVYPHSKPSFIPSVPEDLWSPSKSPPACGVAETHLLILLPGLEASEGSDEAPGEASEPCSPC